MMLLPKIPFVVFVAGSLVDMGPTLNPPDVKNSHHAG
jgi:hypothetical protein